MSRDSTSAGRTPDFRRSMATTRSTEAAVSSAPPASSAVSSSKSPATALALLGRPGNSDLVPADVDIGVECLLDHVQQLVARIPAG